MERTLALEAIKNVGKKVQLCGWVNSRRDHGKLVFIDLRDRSGVVQLVITPLNSADSPTRRVEDFKPDGFSSAESSIVKLRPEDVIEVIGTVKKRTPGTVNPKIPTGTVEIQVEKIKILAKAAELPIDISQPELKVRLPTLLDYRPLSLRHPTQQAIFRIQAEIVQAFREKMMEKGFTEIFCPTITATATEGGAELFHVDYYDYDAYIAQSPQLYKQMMVGVFERVFTIAHAYRAEPSITARHLSEYVGLDAEMGFIDSWENIITTADEVLRYIIDKVFERCREIINERDELKRLTDKEWKTAKPNILSPTPKLTLREAQRKLGKSGKEPDLTPEDERKICEEVGSDLVIITHYPASKRPFYTYPDPENPEYTLSFDFIGRGNVRGKTASNEGFEWVTGGQRINDYQQLLDNIEKWGFNPSKFEVYLQAFKYGMPPEGGFCLGLERITQSLLGLFNIRQASLFPRDMSRVDVRLSTLYP